MVIELDDLEEGPAGFIDAEAECESDSGDEVLTIETLEDMEQDMKRSRFIRPDKV